MSRFEFDNGDDADDNDLEFVRTIHAFKASMSQSFHKRTENAYQGLPLGV